MTVNGFSEKLTGPWGASIAAAGAVAGGIGGGAFYLSLAGIIWGILSVLGGFGVLAILGDVVARLSGSSSDEPVPPLAATTQMPTAAAAIANPAAAAKPDDVLDTEADLLAQGRFDAYHLAKAKRYMTAGDVKQAAYHASASLSHGDLPEARQLRRAARDRA